ncbi:hypothetical protein LEP1GSC043_0696 [Leptospira weilii str. Ecochallenge]|uniref:Uncharacterized protein n=1 Tax=Leptospira weilii str. Ecochallenge TaxID=1049986 RepID=N1UCL7_9LEPT|nr:hypothetical protein LEP1GSC043_0696 [Leptospira weilii str. Ecochallenge]
MLVAFFTDKFVEESQNKNRLIHSKRLTLLFHRSHVGNIFTFEILTKEGFSAMKVEHISDY